MCVSRIAISLLLSIVATACATTQSAVDSVGAHQSARGSCTAQISISPTGGFRQLFLERTGVAQVHLADDVTGVAWISNLELVYTVSPVYGVPGVYVVDCDSPKAKPVTLVASMIHNAAYPNGADYFELKSVVGSQITYYYGRDVDAIDFTSFRTAQNERSFEKP
jgi:hypothetical protein